jgi:hypothetical protein
MNLRSIAFTGCFGVVLGVAVSAFAGKPAPVTPGGTPPALVAPPTLDARVGVLEKRLAALEAQVKSLDATVKSLKQPGASQSTTAGSMGPKQPGASQSGAAGSMGPGDRAGGMMESGSR